MSSPLEKKIAEREFKLSELTAQIDDLQREQLRLEAELSAYRDALQYVNPASKPKRQRASSGGRGGLSDVWKDLLKRASNESTDQFNVDAILSVAEHIDHPMQRNTVRAQCANFVNKELLQRVSDGWFVLTPKGANELGVNLVNAGKTSADENSGSAEPEEAKAESAASTFSFLNPNNDRRGQ